MLLVQCCWWVDDYIALGVASSCSFLYGPCHVIFRGASCINFEFCEIRCTYVRLRSLQIVLIQRTWARHRTNGAESIGRFVGMIVGAQCMSREALESCTSNSGSHHVDEI